MGSSPTADGMAWKAMDEAQEKSSPLGQWPWKPSEGARMLTKAEVWQGRLGVQAHQWIDSIVSKETMHMPAEGRKTMPQQPGPGQPCILSAGLL